MRCAEEIAEDFANVPELIALKLIALIDTEQLAALIRQAREEMREEILKAIANLVDENPEWVEEAIRAIENK